MAENENQIKKRRLESTGINQENSNSAGDLTEKSLLENIHEMIIKNQDEQKKFNEEVLEKLRSAEGKIDKISEKKQKMAISTSDESGDMKEEQENKPIDIDTPQASSDTIVTPTEILPTNGKSFVLKHVFSNVSSMKEYEDCSKEEEHFGVPWKIVVSRSIQENRSDWLAFFLCCPKSLKDENWLIELKLEFKLILKNRNNVAKKRNEIFGNANGNVECYVIGKNKFIGWEKLKEDYVKDDKFTVEVKVHISKMTGIYKDDLRKFDESMAKFSDVILIVKERKFYVLKLFLAANSPYFESLFLGQFQESKKSEITLTGIDSDDFQKYLEVIYGEKAIDEFTVEGILLVADIFDTPIVIQKCEKFLMKKSRKAMRKKLEMATKYNLELLKKKCMEEIKTVTDIRSILSRNMNEMDHSITVALLEKSLELHK